MRRQETGRLGERLAQDFLKQKGYHILETNYRSARDEIDIVARCGKCLVFIEVRTRTGRTFGPPEESVTVNKMKHLERAAYSYLHSHKQIEGPWRFDLVVVEIDGSDKPVRIEIIENALEY